MRDLRGLEKSGVEGDASENVDSSGSGGVRVMVQCGRCGIMVSGWCGRVEADVGSKTVT